ncbi:MAG: PE-PGRS family protein [Polyangiaceae bacterium]
MGAASCADGSTDLVGGAGGGGNGTQATTGAVTSGSTSASTTAATTGATTVASSSSGMGSSSTGVDPCAMGCPTNTYDIDQNPLTPADPTQCGCEYGCTKTSDADPIDDQYKDDNCDGGDGVVEQCVYVSTSQGTANGAGTRQDPVQTIAQGIAVAQANGVPAVCVSGEVYNEAVTVPSGVNLYGGFDQNDADFKFKRSGGVITTVNAAGTVFDVPQLDVETHIEGFTINANANPTPGGSVYGIRFGGGLGQLFVQYNVINTAPGTAGGAGANGAGPNPVNAPKGDDGTDGADGSCANAGNGGKQGTCVEFGGKGGDGGCGTDPGGMGSPGTGGLPGGPGGHADSAFQCSGTTGNNLGQLGNSYTVPGVNGAAGGPGAGVGTVAAGGYSPAAGDDGIPGASGKGGSGGGGGGGGDKVGGTFCNPDRGGGGGAGGCGGAGGKAGKGGGGGGGSFAVFAASGKVVVKHNEMTTGGGGKGGKGGNGAVGQFGGAGGSGASNDYDDAGHGGNGGSGSNGGEGGPGGGGGGGPSACLGYGFGAMVTFSQNVLCSPGFPGQGGAAGTFPQAALATSERTARPGGAQVQIQ